MLVVSLWTCTYENDSTSDRDSGSTFIELDDVEVPVENLLGREGQGFEIITSSKWREPALVLMRTAILTSPPLRLQSRAPVARLHIPQTSSNQHSRCISARQLSRNLWQETDREPSDPGQVLGSREEDRVRACTD